MISLECLLCYGVLLAIFVLILLCVTIFITSERYPIIWRDENEKLFFNAQTKTKKAFPSLYDAWSVHLSVIVPAYNEEKRLPPMLDECLEYLENCAKSGFTYEVIVVSDGSTDKTADIAQNYASKYNTLRILNLVKNRGKGGAVRLGMLSARGSALLFADADGATKFEDLVKLDESLTDVLGLVTVKSCTKVLAMLHYVSSSVVTSVCYNCIYFSQLYENPEETALSDAVICGSRAHLEKEETAKRSYFRLFLMHGFHFLVWLLCVRGVRDTQCGFKLLTRKSARTVFGALHVERWAFDVEMLYIAQSLNIPITEIAVNWTEIDGSKIIPFWSWLQMGKDLFFIWLRYRIGAWKIKTKTA